MPDANTFEVRCERCRTSFAIGTKQCIHCGAALGRRMLGFDVSGGAAPPAGAAGEPNAPDAQPALGRILRVAMIGLVIVTAFARTCIERN